MLPQNQLDTSPSGTCSLVYRCNHHECQGRKKLNCENVLLNVFYLLHSPKAFQFLRGRSVAKPVYAVI